MKYKPRLNDYVSWRNVEGWVYYVDDTHLTIEISVRPKEDDLVPLHKKHHCLIVVQDFQYDELVYVHSRRFANASNLEEMEIYVRNFDNDTYKSQQRTIIFVSYMVTNAFIVSGVLRHWNDVPSQLPKTEEKGFCKAPSNIFQN
jgi:hypothetical protein